jgi:hypothetical protein
LAEKVLPLTESVPRLAMPPPSKLPLLARGNGRPRPLAVEHKQRA